MYIFLRDNPNSVLKHPSFSFGMGIYYDEPVSYKIVDNFKSTHILDDEYIIRSYYTYNYGEKTIRYSSGYYINKEFRAIYNNIIDYYKSSHIPISTIKYKDRYIYRFDDVEEVTSIYDSFSIYLGPTRKKFVYRSNYISENILDRDGLFVFGDKYKHAKIRLLKTSYIEEYRSKHVEDIIKKYEDYYKNQDSYLLYVNESISVDTTGAKIEIDPTKINLNPASDSIRVFINMPPLFINYCITMGDSGDHISVEDGKYIIYLNSVLDRVGVDLADLLPYISMSIYKYHTGAEDRRIDNENVYPDIRDHNIFANLKYKLVDTRDQSLHVGDNSVVFSDSQLWNIKIKGFGDCCLNRTIKITSDGRVSCYIPNVTVKYNISDITEQKENIEELITNIDANGFCRKSSTATSNIPLIEIVENSRKSYTDKSTDTDNPDVVDLKYIVGRFGGPN